MTDKPNTDAAPKAEAKDTAAKPATKAKAETKGGEMKHYVSTSDTYINGKIVPANNPFVTDRAKGADWEEVTPEDAAAIEASTNLIPSDESFDAASKEAVEAFCLIKGVDLRGLKTKEDYIAAAKAVNEPTL